MKNKFIALALVTLVATSTISCTKDETPAATKAQVVGTTNVTVDLKTESENSKTGKTVTRGSLFAWISEIDITAHSNDFAYADHMTPFYLTDSPAGVGPYGTIDATYNLDNVALGSNNFSIVSKCSTPQIMTFSTSGTDANTLMTGSKGKNPYAIYGATVNGVNVVKGANVLPATMLTTTQGRAIAAFTMSPALTALGVTSKVTALPSVPTPQSYPALVLNSNTNGLFYWSNEASVGGTSVLFTVDLFDNNGNKFNTFTTTLNLVASTSVNNIYTISETDITTNTVSETFTAQPWTDQDGNGTVGN